MAQQFSKEVNKQYNAPFNRPTGGHRYAIFFIILGIMAIVGIVGASRYTFKDSATITAGENIQDTIITEIKLGALLREDEATKSNPKIKQKESYVAGEPLVMRVTTDPSIKSPVQLGVRLLTEVGTIIELSPSSVEFKPGTTGFCCWQVEEAGTYTLQIFRPEKVISTIPLKITPAFKSPTSGTSIKFF